MKTLLIAAVLGATALTGVAVAAQTSPARGLKADTNGDGAISRAEFLARAEARFARMDADKNGSVSVEERRMMRGGMARRGGGGRLLVRADTDKDGRVSLAEFRAMPRRQGGAMPAGMSAANLATRQAERFKRWDANADGYVDRAEVSARASMRRHGMTPPLPPAPPGA